MEDEMKKFIITITQCAVMLALSVALSFIKLWDMPLGGAVTLVSMLPMFLVSVKFGIARGLGTAFIYSLFQLLQAIIEGNVFIWCESWQTVVICLLFDYLLPFTLLGIAGIFKNYRLFREKKDGTVKEIRHFGIFIGFSFTVFLRFLCHFITGVVIWGQWAPEGMGKFLYSLAYNGGYLLPELILTIIVGVLLFSNSQIRKLLDIKSSSALLK